MRADFVDEALAPARSAGYVAGAVSVVDQDRVRKVVGVRMWHRGCGLPDHRCDKSLPQLEICRFQSLVVEVHIRGGHSPMDCCSCSSLSSGWLGWKPNGAWSTRRLKTQSIG